MTHDLDAPAVLSDRLERLTTEELLGWAQEMDYFGDRPLVWDGHHGLESPSASVLDSTGTADELLSHLPRHERSALSGDRRRCGGRAQDCRTA